MGHARALLAVETTKKQELLAERVVRKSLNVRQTELLASPAAGAKERQPEREKDVFTRDAEEKLTRSLHSRVQIDRKRRGGSIVIRFSNEEDLMRLFEELTGRRR
jgi:ParB family chromosome partitioning protein